MLLLPLLCCFCAHQVVRKDNMDAVSIVLVLTGFCNAACSRQEQQQGQAMCGPSLPVPHVGVRFAMRMLNARLDTVHN